jgi:hypothetical protein
MVRERHPVRINGATRTSRVLVAGALSTHITNIADNDPPGGGDRGRKDSRLLQAERTVMPDDLSSQDSWFVPPVVIPIFLVVAIVAYALYRFVHLGPPAFG